MTLTSALIVALVLTSACGANRTGTTAATAPGPGGAPTAAVPGTVESGAPAATPMPNRDGSLKFAILGDFGTGSQTQYDLAKQMASVRQRFEYELVILVGDNIYGGERPQDFKKKFEDPYKPLLDAGVKFYGALGNHDSREQRYYKLFNMEGKFYYSFKAPKQDVRFIALDSTYPEPEQIEWAAKELKGAAEAWKIAYFHHPLYSSGGRHGSDLRLRETLEPMFLNENVSVVFQGHDHFYERLKPQKGIHYFVAGSGGKLRAGNIVDELRYFRARIRHRPRVHDRGNLRGSVVVQCDFTDGSGHRLGRDHAAGARHGQAGGRRARSRDGQAAGAARRNRRQRSPNRQRRPNRRPAPAKPTAPATP